MRLGQLWKAGIIVGAFELGLLVGNSAKEGELPSMALKLNCGLWKTLQHKPYQAFLNDYALLIDDIATLPWSCSDVLFC